jgi:flagellar hook-basal body complex protein FliE
MNTINPNLSSAANDLLARVQQNTGVATGTTNAAGGAGSSSIGSSSNSSSSEDAGGSFLQELGAAVQRVDSMQAQADQQVADLLQGKGGDLHGALIAVEKADLSFQLMMQVRNKIVSAYEEIAKMQF